MLASFPSPLTYLIYLPPIVFWWLKLLRLCLYVNLDFFPLSDLKPYKYAGYPMLIKTITIETSDDLLFSKESPLLPAATELAFHTVSCSALNAEELRRESGIEVNVLKCMLLV